MKNMKFFSVISFLFIFSLQSQAALSLEFSFSPFIEEPNVANVHLIASSSNLAYYNDSSVNYSAPSAMIYRLEDDGIVQEANLFYLLSPRSCSHSKFHMVENQAALICQANNQAQINIFSRANQQWTLEQTLVYKGSILDIQDSIPNRFVIKTSEGFAFIEKTEGLSWQLQSINLQLENKSVFLKKLIWIDANRALIQRSGGQANDFSIISKSSRSAGPWTSRQLVLPANTKFGYHGSVAAYQNGILVFSDVTGTTPNPALLRLEIFNLDSQNLLSHLQTLNLGQILNASSPQIALKDGFIYVSKPLGSAAGGADASGLIEIFKLSANNKLFEKFETVIPNVTGQAMFGYQLAVNQDYLFATIYNQPAASQNGALNTFVSGYALPSAK